MQDPEAPRGDVDDPAPATWLDSIGLAVLAAAVAAPGLGSPAAFVFDEIYYVSDAYSHLEVGVGHGFQAHPPLGTWLVALGIAVTDSTVGWRLASLVLGVTSVVLLHRLALRLLPSTTPGRLLAAVAAGLLAADGSWLVLSRTAMLDGPLTTFVLAAALAAVAATRAHSRRGQVLWLVMAGAAVGAATAVKWSGALALLVAAGILALLWARAGRGLLAAWARAIPVMLGAALLVYAATWIPFALTRGDVPFATCPAEAAPCATSGGLDGVMAQHAMLIRYHSSVKLDVTGATPPAYWPLMREPLGFYRPDCHLLADPLRDPTAESTQCEGRLEEGSNTVLYVGNHAIWLGFVALLPLLAAAARRGSRVAVVALAGWAIQWLPWLVVTRTSFIFYMAPTVPFLALGLVAAARAVPRAPVIPLYARAVALAGVGAAIAWATPLSGALALIGWGAAGLATGAPFAPRSPAMERRGLAVASLLGLAALVTAIVMHSSWTAIVPT